MRTLIKEDWAALLALALPFIAIPFVWSQIPDPAPMKWNLEGEVVSTGNKAFGVFLLPIISIFIYALMRVIPAIDPKRKITSDNKIMKVVRLFIPLLFAGIFADMVLHWLEIYSGGGRLPLLIICLFFMMMGNYMNTVPPNYFVGIRTPWTLEDPENWRKTHRLGSRVWVIGSLVMIVLWFFFELEGFIWVFTAGIIVLTFVPVLYSLKLFLAKKKAPAQKSS